MLQRPGSQLSRLWGLFGACLTAGVWTSRPPGSFPGLAYIPQLGDGLLQGLRASHLETTGIPRPRGLPGQVWGPHGQDDPFHGGGEHRTLSNRALRASLHPRVWACLPGSCRAPGSGVGGLSAPLGWSILPCWPALLHWGLWTWLSRSPFYSRPSLGHSHPLTSIRVLPWELQLTPPLTRGKNFCP